jgi:5-methylcytosine-specific restriction endonuclease McrA
MNEIITKKCSKCGIEKLLTDYYRANVVKSGRRPRCKLCTAEDVHNSIISNPIRARSYSLMWKNNHLAQRYEYNKKWVSENKESCLRHKRIRDANRRAKKKNAGRGVTLEEWNEIKNKYGNKCLRCGRTNLKLTMDHVVPISLNGRHEYDNIQPLCGSCNSIKHNKHIDYR